MVNVSFYTYIGFAIAWAIFFLSWLFPNMRNQYASQLRGRQFEAVHMPDQRGLWSMIVVGIIGMICTLTIPEGDIMWADEYENPWVIVHKGLACVFGMVAGFGVAMLILSKYAENVDEIRTTCLMLFAGFILLFQSMLEATSAMPMVQDTKGWDHHSAVVDATTMLTRIFTWSLAFVLFIQIFCADKIFVILQLAMTLGLTLWGLFLAIAFGTTWCDNLDNPNATHCSPSDQGVSISMARFYVVGVNVVSIVIIVAMWHRCVPQWLIDIILPVDQPSGSVPSRLGKNGARAAGVASAPGGQSVQLFDMQGGEDEEETIPLDGGSGSGGGGSGSGGSRQQHLPRHQSQRQTGGRAPPDGADDISVSL